MTTPTPADAKERRLVRLEDGRVGRLLYVPFPTTKSGRPRPPRSTARVEVSGRHVNIEIATLAVIEREAPW